MPQKSGTKCVQSVWEVKPHSVHVSQTKYRLQYTVVHTGTLFGLLLSQGQHITAMAAPVGAHVGEGVPAMRNTVVDLGLVRIRLGIGLSNALGDDFSVALLMAREFTVGALHTSGVFEQFSAQSTAHDVVKLLLDELVAILLVNFFLLLSDCALSTQTEIKRLLVLIVLDYYMSVSPHVGTHRGRTYQS
jgi:hypothetical protein